jgi:hypothetical protein
VRRSGANVILNLHRVATDDGSDYRPLDPGLFDELLSFVKREFAVVTISELGEKADKPKLVLSFDDGYRDFATNAAPILTVLHMGDGEQIVSSPATDPETFDVGNTDSNGDLCRVADGDGKRISPGREITLIEIYSIAAIDGPTAGL